MRKSEKRFAWLGPIRRIARTWFPSHGNAEFEVWQKRNPDKPFKDFFAETVRSRLRKGVEHASLGPSLRGKRFGELSKSGFQKLATFGLRENHVCVDYGCGTLRLGVHLIRSLPPGHYWGLDVDTYLLEEGKKHIGNTLLSEKRPHLHVISPESVAAAAKHKPDFLVSMKVLIHVHPQELGEFIDNILTIVGESGRAVITGKWSSEETIQLSELSWAHADWPKGTYPEGGVHYRFFDVMVDPESRRYLSEDYGFCRIWEAIGGKIFVDANSNLSHQGERLYTGDFAATLRTALPSAVGAPEGQRMHITGLENLKPSK